MVRYFVVDVMNAYRILGFFCLVLLAALCVQSLDEAPRKWGGMPSLDYVIEYPGSFEGRYVIVDGVVSSVAEGSSPVSFMLGPLTGGAGEIRVEAPVGTRVAVGRDGVNVRGVVRNGVIYAESVTVSKFPWLLELFFNFAGLSVFLYYSFREWSVSLKRPYIQRRCG